MLTSITYGFYVFRMETRTAVLTRWCPAVHTDRREGGGARGGKGLNLQVKC